MAGVLVHELVDRAIAAQRALADLGEQVEDEWTYVNDLHEAWAARLGELADARGDEPVVADSSDAIDEAIAEIGSIVDPHRAIDWLSTFPQVVLLALGERG
ncbi:MAG: hypothetical protein QOF11_2200 [Chloroflexota bacterium]|jgi:hypothetical protein|nr:hypothetical protein [Chloroflexota bacterium]